ncbi:hypothetical protein [Anabaena sp. CCY 9402-a]
MNYLLLEFRLVQHGINKPPIPNQQNPYAVFILSFDFRLVVLVPGAKLV